jgi:ABC-type oligopeptide transport system ATPase subunit
VADECVVALDVPIQADILKLLKSLQQPHGLTFLFISQGVTVPAIIAHQMFSPVWDVLDKKL